MAQLTIVYWRDIPAQVIVKQGRKTARRELAQRFQEAVDMAAMRAKAIGTDDYLADWRRSDPVDCGDDLEAEADAWQEKLEAEYDDVRLKQLVQAKGYSEGNQA
ncbi:virulence factor [Thalassospiraceae bacterium LMO-JJ14]|nr:virulence factor [Thalassospiraceae bacterium LMO-JJ14]